MYQEGFVICSKTILLKINFFVWGLLCATEDIMKNKRDAQNHKVCHDYSKFTNKKTEAWKSLTYTQSHADGNKAETQMWVFLLCVLFEKTKIKFRYLHNF